MNERLRGLRSLPHQPDWVLGVIPISNMVLSKGSNQHSINVFVVETLPDNMWEIKILYYAKVQGGKATVCQVIAGTVLLRHGGE